MVDEKPPSPAANTLRPRRKGGTLVSASLNSLDGLRAIRRASALP